MTTNNTNIVKIIEWISENFLGSKEYPGDVKIKYLIEDELYPYWWVQFNRCSDFDEYNKLNKVVESFNFKMVMCDGGIWLMERKLSDK